MSHYAARVVGIEPTTYGDATILNLYVTRSRVGLAVIPEIHAGTLSIYTILYLNCRVKCMYTNMFKLILMMKPTLKT